MPTILLISPYDGLSHRYWRESLADYLATGHPQWQVSSVTQPPRYFSWRQRGNSLGLALHDALQGPVDLMIATSVTDLSALRGMNRALAGVPAVVYCHENQFAYPDTHNQGLLERQLTSIYTAISADRVLFNSEWNRRSFLKGADELLAKMPDEVPAGITALIEAKSQVLPVALDAGLVPVEEPASPAPGTRTRRRIAWNHRWEHDKGPAQLLAIVEALLDTDLDFEFSLFGQRFRQVPAELARVIELLTAAGRLIQADYEESRSVYLARLATHDLVLSTALQEFQGLAVQEAIQLGCIPVVPDALCYPEYVAAPLRYRTVDQAVAILCGDPPTVNQSLDAYQWDVIGPRWDQLLVDLLAPR